jgi:hypothetical protein
MPHFIKRAHQAHKIFLYAHFWNLVCTNPQQILLVFNAKTSFIPFLQNPKCNPANIFVLNLFSTHLTCIRHNLTCKLL